jgi:hypothetical protein
MTQIRTAEMKTLLRALKDIRDGKRHHGGICCNVLILTRRTYDRELSELMRKWPEYSYDPDYPVPHPSGNFEDPQYAYAVLPRWEGEYGAARLRLLDFMIAELESRDANHP